MSEKNTSETPTGIKLKSTIHGQELELEVSEGIISKACKPITDGYGFVSDWVEDRRALNQFERQNRYKVRAAGVLIKTQEELKRLGVTDPTEPTDKFLEIATPVITVEDNKLLQNMWATLFAKAMVLEDVENYEGLALILKELPSEAVRVLHYFATISIYALQRDSGMPPTIYEKYSQEELVDWSFEHTLDTFDSHLKLIGPDGYLGYAHLKRLYILSETRDIGLEAAFKDNPTVNPLLGRRISDDDTFGHMARSISGLTIEQDYFTPIGLELIELIRSMEPPKDNLSA